MKKVSTAVCILTSTVAIIFSLGGCSLKKNDAAGNQQKVGLPGDESGKQNLTIEQQVIQNVAASIVLQTYKDLATNTAALRDQVVILAAAPNQANLDLAQDRWRATRVSWESTEAFLFGPVESLSVDPLIDTWPLNIADLSAILNSGASVTPASIRTIGTNLKGFHTAEFLLFGDGKQTNHKSVSALTTRELEYLKSVVEVLAEDTARLARAWETQSDPDNSRSEAYVQLLMNPGPDRVYASNSAVISELINGMAAIADEVANGKIAEPLGASASQADPTREESPFSWNSVSDFSNNIRSVRMVFTGVSATGNGLGLKTLVDAKNPALGNALLAQIDLTIAKIQAISEPDGLSFGRAILSEEGRGRVLTAQKETSKLSEMIKLQLIPFFQN